MSITLTWQTVITAAAVIGAAVAIWKYFSKVVLFMEDQKQQKQELEQLRKDHDSDIAAIKEELTLMTYGLLACLKGLAEQGCDGPVHEAIDKIEKHLNLEAHK